MGPQRQGATAAAGWQMGPALRTLWGLQAGMPAQGHLVLGWFVLGPPVLRYPVLELLQELLGSCGGQGPLQRPQPVLQALAAHAAAAALAVGHSDAY